mmetsp:Transcript_13219/g.29134  ORF Transcript_13219/g.29134 Transcript_13219/m.29134 type:complete len:213 (+) Transcript_13219:895-1533(+)
MYSALYSLAREILLVSIHYEHLFKTFRFFTTFSCLPLGMHNQGIKFSTVAVNIDTTVLLNNFRSQAKLVAAKGVALVANMVNSVFPQDQSHGTVIQPNPSLMPPPMPRKPSITSIIEVEKKAASPPKEKTLLDQLYDDFEAMSKMFSATSNTSLKNEYCDIDEESGCGDKRSRHVWFSDDCDSPESEDKKRKVDFDGIIKLSDLFNNGHTFS